MKHFNDVVGQKVVVAALLERSAAGKHRPLMLWGPEGSGKLSLARLYAKSVLCQSPTKPCGVCSNCQGVMAAGSLRYIELDARVHHSHDHVRDQLTKLRSVGMEPLVLVVRNAECLPGPVSDRLLKPLEKIELHVAVFLSSDMMKVSAAIKSRCQVYEMIPSPIGEVVADLRTRCIAHRVNYEDRALEILACGSDGWVGRAQASLQVGIIGGAIGVNEALSACGFGKGKQIAECWLAALRGEVDTALRQSLQIGGDCVKRADAMQGFVRAFHSRYARGARHPDVAHTLAVEDVDEQTWLSIRHEWEQVATALNRPLRDCVRDVLRFWIRMHGVASWNLIFAEFCRLLHGHKPSPAPLPCGLAISNT